MNRAEFVGAILVEMQRVWGDEGHGGTIPEYEWLLFNYGITEEEDVRWQLVLEYDELLSDEDQEDDEVMDFVLDEPAVLAFLTSLLQKYRSGSVTYIDGELRRVPRTEELMR
jgi:hypothetical protein